MRTEEIRDKARKDAKKAKKEPKKGKPLVEVFADEEKKEKAKK